MNAIRNCCQVNHRTNSGRRLWLRAALSRVTLVAGTGFDGTLAEAAALTTRSTTACSWAI
ncbi:hypothetical protein BX592_102252 [Paraburkholderia rhizosphaerae]|uniref:Uncharacterized protein n=1 Tax=Paraburkholderia rhizosphaerae TaxID=480658 RepID=A0A4R8M2V4_9BURK|nr:hypothetical protein BX592_102252 [Paraburkholderia rhizosphaerae]